MEKFKENEIGSYMEEINNYSTENQEEWFENFSKNLSGIQRVLESKDAKNLFRASILESANMKLNTLMENIDEVKKDLSDKDYQTVRKLLLIDLNSLMN
ncbi:MAG: hypothetical protein HY773_02860 [Candidatus Terrybacteria bacterium]|nr:hypothetical protein [Candidatus Terrybacteria bacterium]